MRKSAIAGFVWHPRIAGKSIRRQFLHHNYALACPCHKQERSYTCVAACVKMALQYFGVKIDELKFYKKSRLSPDFEGLCDVCIVPELSRLGFKVVSYWNGRLEDWGVWTQDLARLYRNAEKRARRINSYVRRRNATVETIKGFIDKGIPVIAEVLAGKFYSSHDIGTHTIVIRGYNKQGFFVCDPYAGSYLLSYKRFVRAWIPSKRFGRSLMIILPK